jgi:hypothetical protein
VIKSLVRSESASLRIRRAAPVQPVSPITSTIMARLGPKMKQ